jgi:hypothetical protein
MRLRCRAHNQYEAERAFGAEFMNSKRCEARLAKHEARLAAEDARVRAAATEKAQHALAAAKEQSHDLLAGLRGLGFRADEARRAAEFSETHGATLEERMRAALKFLSRSSIQTMVPAGPAVASAGSARRARQ